MGNQHLPRKILTVLKKVRYYLNRRANASNSDPTTRKMVNTAIAVVVLMLLSGFMLAQVMSAIQLSSTISNVGTLKVTVGIGVYWDDSFTNRTTTINWGTFDPGTSKSFSIYIRNEGNSALTLSMSPSNWNPSTASNYLTLTWNYNGQTINPNSYVRVTITLAVSPSTTGISNFSFDINLVGSG